MKCCVSTDTGTWTNLLTFEPDSDYSPDAGTGLLSPLSYQCCYAEFYVGKIRCIKTWFYNGFIYWDSEPSKRLCRRYMRSTECPSSMKFTFCGFHQLNWVIRKNGKLTAFYRAMLCIARTILSQDACLSLRLSVCLSVTRRYSVKTGKHMIKLS